MQKIKIFVIMSLTSLALMGCSVFGIFQFGTSPTQSKTENEKNMTENSQNEIQQSVPTATLDPVTSSAACISRTWEIDGLNEFILAAIPPELAAEYQLTYEGTNGSATFQLTPEGDFTMNADKLEILFSAKAAIFSVPVVVLIDGTAKGKYELDETTITISNVDTSPLSASAKALGEDLVDPNQIINAFPLLKPPFNTAKYICQGNTLQFDFTNYPGDFPPVVFRAAK